MKRPDDNALAQAGELPRDPFEDTVPIGADGTRSEEEADFAPQYPQSPPPLLLRPEALIGPAGQFVNVIGPHTEAAPAALLGQFLVAFGSAVGRRPYYQIEADRHHLNEYLGLVGESSKARKGTSWGHVRRLFETIDPAWIKNCVLFGLSSGEGVTWSVRDEVVEKEPVRKKGVIAGYQDVIRAQAVSDKRALFLESELGGVIRLLGREGSILSPVLRCAWDDGNLRITTKNSPVRATDAHISLIGHVTIIELRRCLKDVELANGFANRFLWFWVYRSKLLPDGGAVPEDEFARLTEELGAALATARRATRIERDRNANALWHDVYPDLSAAGPGLLGVVTARAEAHVARLACLYALLDGTDNIGVQHLQAALAVWEYAFESAARVFGRSLGNTLADRILALLDAAPDGLTRTQVRIGLHDNKYTAAELNSATGILLHHRLAILVKAETGKRKIGRLVRVRVGVGRLGSLGRNGDGLPSGEQPPQAVGTLSPEAGGE